MNQTDAERIITEYVKPVFGFALKRCRSISDAEDLSQDILLKVYKTLLRKDDIADVSKYIWTIAHNALANYYRDNAKSSLTVSLDEIEDEAFADESEQDGAIEKLQSEIAYLSKMQRRIVIAYYFENKKQSRIAEEMNIPLGTVKWHLFEARKELKRGIQTMRKTSELKFNPIKLSYHISGTFGESAPDKYLGSALAQNICYCIKDEAKTVNEIADDLGVSPVYVEDEIENLGKYDLLKEENGRYIADFVIEEKTAEIKEIESEVYSRAAAIFAPELYDELVSSGIAKDSRIECPEGDENFMMWALVPYIASATGRPKEEKISFDDAATRRADGAHNIVCAFVTEESEKEAPAGWNGPMYNGLSRDGCASWEMDSPFKDGGNCRSLQYYSDKLENVRLFERYENNTLLESDKLMLAERGLVKINENGDAVWLPVILHGKDIVGELVALGENIREKHKAELEALKEKYCAALLSGVSAQVRHQMEYQLQYTFSSDGSFVSACIKYLVGTGKFALPSEDMKKALSMVFFTKQR